jgi:hypothetical protein
MKSVFRVFFALAVSLSLTFGALSGIGTSMALAASSQPTTADGYNPVGSVPTGIDYCYPSGYNKQGWRCGWRLAMYPYNLGSYYGYNYGYNPYYYGYNPYYYGYGYNYGYGGKVPAPITDYKGLPRFGPYYYNYYYQNNYPCYYVNGYMTCY